MHTFLNKYDSKDLSIYALALFNVSLLTFRVSVTESLYFGFLIWNLILSGIPFLITYSINANQQVFQKKNYLYAISLLWLLFLPNAPYLITDFLHFKRESNMPSWFDLLLLMSFSWSGIMFGMLSIREMQRIWTKSFNTKISWIFIFSCCLLSGFGIYIGRYLRYNSWDIITNPFDLISDMFFEFITLKAIGFSIGYGIFFFLSYSFFKINTQK